MRILVLAKAVPALDRLVFDPVRRTVDRSVAELFLNPFDQRALRVGIDLRRDGDRVLVASLGPPAAVGPLREAMAVGADRAILVTDPAFAGSDTLATSRALAGVVRAVDPQVVLVGAWTTDSETGQVGPELAALLGWPVATVARSLEWDPARSGIEVVCDTADGWAGWHLPLPAVVSVGEKIAKPLRPDPAALAGVADAAIDRWSAEQLGVPVEAVGLRGSPTIVVAVQEAAVARTPVVVADGEISTRVERAVRALAPRLRARVPVPPLPPVPGEVTDGSEVAVLVTGPDGTLLGGTVGAVAEVRRALPGHWASVVWVGAPPTEADRFRLAGAGARAGYLDESAEPRVDPDRAVAALEGLLRERPRLAGLILAADPFGREVAGALAARNALGLTGDAIGLHLDVDGTIVWTKPSFGGRTVATIRSRTRPSVATARPGVFAVPPPTPDRTGFVWHTLEPTRRPSRRTPRGSGREVGDVPELDAFDVIVAVGMGVGGPDGIARLAPTLRRWGAGLAATRRVVDAGWVPRQRQVGLTGHLLAPRLAILLGVSGSVNHAVGWRRAGAVLAVNRDPAAPVFQDVDVGIVGEIDAVLPALVGPIAAALGR